MYMVIHPSRPDQPESPERVRTEVDFRPSKPRRMAQSLDGRIGSARSVNKHATVDVQGVAGDVAREVGRTARLEKSQLVRAWTCTICSSPDRTRRWAFKSEEPCVQSSQEDNSGRDFDRLAGTLQRSAVDAGNVLQFGTHERQSSCP